MKVLISGAASLVGTHFARRLARDHHVIALKHADLDITDAEAVRRSVATTAPDLIINPAVIQVDESERDPELAFAVNVEGARALAQAAERAGIPIIHFSTQYAFDGETVERPPYTIEDAPRPVNVYGKTKVASEKAVADACSRSYIIRTSWVFGQGKNTFLCTVHKDLVARKPISVIVDIWSSTTYVEDLIDRVLEIVARGRYGIYHVVNGGVCSYYDFALEAGQLVGLTAKEIDQVIKKLHESEMQRSAVRPRYTPLRCLLSERLGLAPMRDWRAALAAYVRSST
ncbi:MAG TPA: dTDP-4-dehydrorhamnose reductase [Candidatus Binatia bacterium]